jgi:uncharacterized cupredoxin-like copper-binding protein
VFVALLVPLFSSCASTRSAAHGTRVVVVEHDFGLRLSRATVPAGQLTFHVVNDGPSTHELNLDRTADADTALPLKADGLTVNEDSSSLDRIGSIEVVRLDEAGDFTVSVKPGRYVLYCNLEGHYLGGMRAALDVTA